MEGLPSIFSKRKCFMFFEAIFKPSETIQYKDDVKDLAGKKIAVQEGWIVEDGPLKGQHCFYIPNSSIGLIPMSDLQNLKPVSFAKWQELRKSLEIDS
jgi:hypothetical protein